MGKTHKSKKQSRQKQKDKRQSRGKRAEEANAGTPAFVPAGDAPSREITRLRLRKPSVKELEWHIEVVWGDELYAVAVSEKNMALIEYVAGQQTERQRESWLGRAEAIEGVSPGKVAKFYSDLSKEKGWRKLKPEVILAYWRVRLKKQSRVYQWCNGRLRKRFRKGPKGLVLSADAAELLDGLFSHSSSSVGTSKLGLGDLESTWISWDEEETYRVNAPKVLEAMRRHRLGKSWKKKPFRWVERTYVARQGGREVDRFPSIKKLLKFILGHETANLFVIHSESSLGKSMLLIELALHMLKNEDAKKFAAAVGIIPLYVEAYRLGKNWEDSLAKVLGPLPRLEVRGEKAFMGNASEDDRRLFVQEISGKRKKLTWSRALVLLIDGVNEARGSTFFTQLGSEFSGCKKIIATRDPVRTILPKQPPGYCVEIELLPFSASQAHEFCDRVDESVPAAGEPEHEKWMPTLVRSPMLLGFYLSLEPETRKGIASRYGLYERVFENIKKNEHDKFEDLRKKTDAKLPAMLIEVLYSVLSAIVYEALGRGRTRVIDRRTLAEIIDSVGVRQAAGSRYSADKVHKALEGYRTFVASIGDAGQLEFYHEEFCHFLAAQHILENWGSLEPSEVCRWLLRPGCDGVTPYLGGGITDRCVLDSLLAAFEGYREHDGELVDQVNVATSWDLRVRARLVREARVEPKDEYVAALLVHVRTLTFEKQHPEFAVPILNELPLDAAVVGLVEDILNSPVLTDYDKWYVFKAMGIPDDSDLVDRLVREMLIAPHNARWALLLLMLTPYVLRIRDPDVLPQALSSIVRAILDAKSCSFEGAIMEALNEWDCWQAREIVDALHQMLVHERPGCQRALSMMVFAWAFFDQERLPARFRPAVLDHIQNPHSEGSAGSAVTVARAFWPAHKDTVRALEAAARSEYPYSETARMARFELDWPRKLCPAKKRRSRRKQKRPPIADAVIDEIKNGLGPTTTKPAEHLRLWGPYLGPRLTGCVEEYRKYCVAEGRLADVWQESPILDRLTEDPGYLVEELLDQIIPFLDSGNEYVRRAAGSWIVEVVLRNPGTAKKHLKKHSQVLDMLYERCETNDFAAVEAVECVQFLGEPSDPAAVDAITAALSRGIPSATVAAAEWGLLSEDASLREEALRLVRQFVSGERHKLRFVLLHHNRLGRIAASLGNVEELARLALDGMQKASSNEIRAIQIGILAALRPLLS